MAPTAAKKRKNDDGSVNLEGYSPFASRIHMSNIYPRALPGLSDGYIRKEPGKAKIRCIYTPTLGLCVLKELFMPKSLSSLSIEEINDEERKKKYREREIQYTSAIDNHPNILRFYGYAVDDTQVRGLISEYMPLGSLAQALFHYGTPERVTSWAIQLARALAYCHEANVVHRDIKLDNVLLAGDGETIKLCDFEFARQVSHDMTNVWSYGMCLYVMTHRKYVIRVSHENLRRLPFELNRKTPLHEFREKLLKGMKPEVIQDSAYNPLLYTLMELCWELDPTHRPTMLTIVGILDPEAGQHQQALA